MGKKKERRRVLEAATSRASAPILPFPAKTFSDDPDKPVSIATMLTEADRYRLKVLSIEKGISLQRMGHRAWNSLLASYGLPGLTPVSQGKSKREQGDGQAPA